MVRGKGLATARAAPLACARGPSPLLESFYFFLAGEHRGPGWRSRFPAFHAPDVRRGEYEICRRMEQRRDAFGASHERVRGEIPAEKIRREKSSRSREVNRKFPFSIVVKNSLFPVLVPPLREHIRPLPQFGAGHGQIIPDDGI